MFARHRLMLSLGVLALVLVAGCGGDSKPLSTASSTASSAPSAIPTFAANGSPGALLSPGASGIVQVQMASSLAPDGSAHAPTTSFNHGTDRKIVAVLTLANLGSGTKLSYVRYLDGKFVDSKSATMTKNDKYFYFTFTALAGKDFTVGHYRLRLYVNEHALQETAYQVL